MIKPKLWKGNDLEGEWEITLKIDGVRMLRDELGNPVSRSGKPLYNLDSIDKGITDAEIYYGSWEDSVSRVRTKVSGIPVESVYCFRLNPPDERLRLGTFNSPTRDDILGALTAAVEKGLEGLVLRQGNTWLKVKPKETHDVTVSGMIEGTGKYVGMLGAFQTDMGKVGTGFTDAERKDLWKNWNLIMGSTIEVECMHLTKDGKFRHPVFKRLRWDK